MSVAIVSPAGLGEWRVRCTECGGVYVTRSCPANIALRRGCSDCFPGMRGKPGRPRDPVTNRFLPGKVGT